MPGNGSQKARLAGFHAAADQCLAFLTVNGPAKEPIQGEQDPWICQERLDIHQQKIDPAPPTR